MLIDPRGYRIKRRIAKQITDRERFPSRDYRENLCSRNRYFDLVFFFGKHLLRHDQAKRSWKSSQEDAFPGNLPIAGGTSRHSAGSFYRTRSFPTSLRLFRSSVASSSPLIQYALSPFRLPVPGFSPSFTFFLFCLLPFSLSGRLSSLVSSSRFLVARDRFHQRGAPSQPAASPSRSPTKQAKTVRRVYTSELTE